MSCNFTYVHYKEIFKTALDEGYQVITLADWFQAKYDSSKKVLINRVDVDDNISRLWIMGGIYQELGIKASIFMRLHTKNYNLLFFDNMNLVRRLSAMGNEIGLHSEIVDVDAISKIAPEKALRAGLDLMQNLFDIQSYGVASHGDMTPNNNLDFWKEHSPSEFGLLYEAYDKQLWNNSLYVSDSEFTRWKAYDRGRLLQGDTRCACEHIKSGAPVIYLLTHTCSYYNTYIHEQTEHSVE